MNDASRQTIAPSAERRRIFEQVLASKGIRRSQAQVITPRGGTGDCPVSFAQQRLWFLEQLVGGTASYNVTFAQTLSGILDEDALEQAFNALAQRHEALRTTVQVVDGQPRQVVAPFTPFAINRISLASVPDAQRAATARELLTKEAGRPLDLARGPLFVVTLLHLGDAEHVLLLNIHHAICDGWSLDVLTKDLLAYYAAFSSGQVRSHAEAATLLPPLPVQYGDYAVWQRAWLAGAELERQRAYWRDRLAGMPAVLNMPTTFARPPVQSHRGTTYAFALPAALAAALRALSLQAGTTLFMTLLAGFQALLARYSDQDDIAVGVPIAGRTHAELEQLIGLFVNTLVLRTSLGGRPTTWQLLARVREAALGAFAHQDLPFEALVEELQPVRDTSHNPLFQVAFHLQHVAAPDPGACLMMQSLPLELGTAKVDITLAMEEAAEGLEGVLEYSTDLFDEAMVARLAGHYIELLQHMVARPDASVGSLPLLTAGELAELRAWNDTARPFPSEQCVHQRFEQHAAHNPEATALVCGGRQLSYGDLDRRANQLAHVLRSAGVGPETLVGVCLERSPELIVSILGILKAGGTYLPLDPAYPAERLAFMLEDSAPVALLTEQRLSAALPMVVTKLMCLDQIAAALAQQPAGPPDAHADALNLAYVIYTSGSTGRPKGAMLQHRGLCSMVDAQATAFGVGAHSRVLQFASMSFDASIFEIFMALGSGATLCMVEGRAEVLTSNLPALVAELGATVVTLPPSVLSLHAAATLPTVDVLTVAGEACPAELVARWAGEHRLFNLYGVTEATVWNTMIRCDPEPRSPAIGKAIANTEIYLLDAHLQPVPIGVPGELCIGGVGLARGYLHRPDLTAERFVPHPFGREPGARLYRSGDLASFRSDGTIDYLGRIDDQVKVRGFRIEPGEIQARLQEHPAVHECVVTTRDAGNPAGRLIAYAVCDVDQPTPAELRAHLQATLPTYMVPGTFVFLAALPRSPNGKVDRRHLPVPESERPHLDATFVAPRGELERVIAAIWRKVLGLEQVGVEDNFFDLGGHSLRLVQVFGEVRGLSEKHLSMVEMFRHPTIRSLATYLTAEATGPAAAGGNEAQDRARRKIEALQRRNTSGRSR